MLRMKTRREIVENWLPRYTGTALKKFGDYILLTNFDHYVDLFIDRPPAQLPAWILAVPLGVWVVRRVLARARHPRSLARAILGRLNRSLS